MTYCRWKTLLVRILGRLYIEWPNTVQFNLLEFVEPTVTFFVLILTNYRKVFVVLNHKQQLARA